MIELKYIVIFILDQFKNKSNDYKKSRHLWRLKLLVLAVKNCHKWIFWRFKKSSKLCM